MSCLSNNMVLHSYFFALLLARNGPGARPDVVGSCITYQHNSFISTDWPDCGMKKSGHEGRGRLFVAWSGIFAARVCCCPSSALWLLNSQASVAQ